MKTAQSKSTPTFKLDIEQIRKNARQHVEEGAQTASYKGNVAEIIALLNDSLATEIVCALRYRRHFFTATGIHSKSIAAEFKIHADEELAHADLIAERIVQLGGEPDFNPDSLRTRSHADYVECNTLKEMIKENLVAERIAIDAYHALIRHIGDDDPTTRIMLEGILAQEEEHADELSDWISIA
jgi:bacterioferritin